MRGFFVAERTLKTEQGCDFCLVANYKLGFFTALSGSWVKTSIDLLMRAAGLCQKQCECSNMWHW